MTYDSDLNYRFGGKTLKVGVIGCGIRARVLIHTLSQLNVNTRLTAVCDLKGEEILRVLAADGEDISQTKLYTDADTMLSQEELDGVIIGSRTESHVELAKKVLSRGLPLMIEKPITTSLEELIDLRNAYEKSNKQVLVSFPLRASPLVELAREIIESGKIGTVEHVQAVNYVPYGGVYYHNWYRRAGVGGLFFEKSTHDFDYLNYLVGQHPTELAAMATQRIFGGEYPDDKTCPDCERLLDCPESPFNQKHIAIDNPRGELCAFAKSIENHDSAGVLIRYPSGLHVNYAENYFARKGAQARGARLSGYRGTLEFDWYQNKLTVHMHHTPRVDTYAYDADTEGHFGGDAQLMLCFAGMMRGERTSIAPLEAGFESTLMCIAARASVKSRAFERIGWKEQSI